MMMIDEWYLNVIYEVHKPYLREKIFYNDILMTFYASRALPRSFLLAATVEGRLWKRDWCGV